MSGKAGVAALALAAFCLAAALAVPSLAGPSNPVYVNDYEGKAERDPATYVGFDVVKRKGQRKVAKVSAHLHYSCTSGATGRGTARARGKLAVTGGEFAGRVEVPPETAPVRARGTVLAMHYDVSGRLGKRGKARGRIAGLIRFAGTPRRRGGTTRCYTGRLDWRARRGADADPVSMP